MDLKRYEEWQAALFHEAEEERRLDSLPILPSLWCDYCGAGLSGCECGRSNQILATAMGFRYVSDALKSESFRATRDKLCGPLAARESGR